MNINKTLNIAIACFVGAFIGALLAIQFHHYWLFGVLIGGVVGYMTYNFREIPTTAKSVWAMLPERQDMKQFIADCELKKKMKSVLKCLFFGLTVIILLVTILVGLLSVTLGYLNAVMVYEELSTGSPFFLNHTKDTSVLEIIIGNISAVGVTLIAMCSYFTDDEKDKTLLCIIILLIIGIPILTPFLLPVVAFVGSGFGIYWIGKVGIKVGWATFKIVHSDIRLLCMVDAMIGATAGYCLGNALIGGIIGAISGVINYELVSKRWLKLLPSQVKSDS